MSADLNLTVDVAADAEVTWRAATDWARQGEWMLGTTVLVTEGDGHSVGSRLSARTGAGPVGFTDTMEITEWDPVARRCVVQHTGRVVRGGGVFSVSAGANGGSVFHWAEMLDLPLGGVGRVGWPLVRPAFVGGVKLSLRRFADFCAAYGSTTGQVGGTAS
jgi:hypothetical protein